jgi:hypothetical protein
MSILVNLLPDLRQAKLRERRRRQLVSGVAVTVWVICGGVVILMALYVAGQKVIIANYTSSINSEKKQLQAVPNLLDAYTAEQHLASLPGLYSQRVFMTKFFDAYSQSDPTVTNLESLTIDSSNTLTVQGVGPTYASVAKLARALAAMNVSIGTSAQADNTPYFSNVQITTVTNAQGKGVTYGISATIGSGATGGSQQ